MIQNTQIKNPKMGGPERGRGLDRGVRGQGLRRGAAAGPVPDRRLPARRPVDSATYFGKLYAYPSTSDGGLLYYRKDLLDKYDLQPPTTFDEMKAACDKIKAGEKDDKLDCFAGQYNKYEGLTVNFDEAVHGAGGVIVGDDGKPNVATPGGDQGSADPGRLVQGRRHPEGRHHLDRKSRVGRRSRTGQLIFHRNWGYVYNLGEPEQAVVRAARSD